MDCDEVEPAGFGEVLPTIRAEVLPVDETVRVAVEETVPVASDRAPATWEEALLAVEETAPSALVSELATRAKAPGCLLEEVVRSSLC